MIIDSEKRLFEMMFRVAKLPANKTNVSHLTKEEFFDRLPKGQQVLNEIDWEKEFGDTTHSCLRPDAIVKWLNDELNRLRSNQKKKEKDKIPAPKRDIIMAQGNIEKLLDKTGDINLDIFIKNIALTEPSTIFDANRKMEKSDVGRPQMTINTGLPAIVAIVFDIEKDKFYSVSTCPAAGTCQIGCYARDAFYRMNEDLIMKLTRRINLLLNNPKRYEERVYEELLEHISSLPKDYKLIIRWNDAGDFFSRRYLDVAKNVTKKLIDEGYNVKSYAYTKRADYVMELDKDNNFTISFSTDANRAEQEKIAQYSGASSVKLSHKVPAYKTNKIPYKHKEGYHEVKVPLWKHFFQRKGPHYVKGDDKKLIFSTPTAQDDLKNYIMDTFGQKYNLKKNNLLYTWELPFEDEGGRKYDVIVLPSGDTDIPAQREDVRISFLLEH